MTMTNNTHAASGAANNCTILPDGSAFAVASFPLPKDHWLYAPREYDVDAENPKELPSPILTHALRAEVVSAIRYAIRGATMCGKETDFDPDALVQNAVYALCGSYGSAALAAPVQAAAPDMTDAYAGAREDLSIWKKRALEAEALNRKFTASVNSPSFMGEPAAPAQVGEYPDLPEAAHCKSISGSASTDHSGKLNLLDLFTSDQMRAYADATCAARGAAKAAPAEAERLDYLQECGVTVEVLPGRPGWTFRIGGLHGTVHRSVRTAIDAARAAQEGK